MTEYNSAKEEILDTYPPEILKQILEDRCRSGVAFKHVYYKETVPFFDKYEDEIIKTISDYFGEETLEGLKADNPDDETGYKNDVVWFYIELISAERLDEIENEEEED